MLPNNSRAERAVMLVQAEVTTIFIKGIQITISDFSRNGTAHPFRGWKIKEVDFGT